MHDDGLHAVLATSSAIMIYGWTLESIVLMLWGLYVVILIAIKIPEMIERHAWIGRLWRKWRRKRET